MFSNIPQIRPGLSWGSAAGGPAGPQPRAMADWLFFTLIRATIGKCNAPSEKSYFL